MKSGYDQFFLKAKENASQDFSEVPETPALRYKNFMSKKRELKNKNKKSFPFLSVISFGICIVFSFLLIEKFDSIETYISKIEIGLGTAQAEEASPASKEVKPATEQPVVEKAKSEDSADYLFKLAERKKELDAREEDLNKKAAEVAKQKTEVESKLKQLEESRDKISSMLKERISSDSQKVDNLVQVYSNMKPSQAAKVFETMDQDLVIEILSRMKKKSAADILNLVKTDKAQLFSERYAGYRAPAAEATNNEPSPKGTDDKTEVKNKP